jgi:hypothetical protein
LNAKTKLSTLRRTPLAAATRQMVTRAGKGDELTWDEMDGNWIVLDQDLATLEARVEQLAQQSGVSSVNGKVGAVTITAAELHAFRSYLSRSTEIINGVTYRQFIGTPSQEAAAASAINPDTQAGIFNLIAQFISGPKVEQTLVHAGAWPLRLWMQASHANCRLVIQVSRLNTDTFVKTHIHNVTLPDLGTELKQFALEYEQPTPIILNANERLVVEMMCYSEDAGRTIAVLFDSIDRQSYVDVPVAQAHNLLALLQGGAEGEYFHFTAAQHAALLDMLANRPGTVVVQRFYQSGTYRKPARATLIEGYLLGGGAGGESGAVAADGVLAPGGGGGAGGARTEFRMDGAAFPDSVAIVVGRAGIGGAASSSAANPGTAGTESEVDVNGVIFRASGGIRSPTGTGGLWPGGAGGVGGNANNPEGGGGQGTFNSTLAAPGGGAPGGGGGGAVSVANVASAGGAGAFSVVNFRQGSNAPDDTRGLAGGGDAPDIPTHATYSRYAPMGVSGGGGGGHATGDGGDGGDAGGFGAGGGGGGGARDGFMSGAGGNGAPGLVIMLAYCE